MTWHYFETEMDGRRAGILLDDRFALRHPSESLPELAWFGVYCRLNPGSAYWHPDETNDLDRIEADMLRLCELVGKDSAAYVRRVDTRGIREYYIYFRAGVDIASVLPRLQVLYPNYRIEYEHVHDGAWNQYRSWLDQERAP